MSVTIKPWDKSINVVKTMCKITLKFDKIAVMFFILCRSPL